MHAQPPTYLSAGQIWDIDPFGEAVLLDPEPYYDELRRRGPAVWLSRYGIWAMGRHRNVHAAFSDHQRFCSGRGVGLSDFATEPPWRPPSLVLETDPPEHTRARTVIARALSPRAVRELRAPFQAAADAAVDRVLRLGRFDGVADLAEPYPLKVFPDAVGLRAEHRKPLLPYGRMVFDGMGPDNAIRQRAMAAADQVIPWISAQCERENLSPDGFGATIYEAVDRGELTAAEAPLLVRSLLSAGVDTTIIAAANALLCLATHPEQWSMLRADPGLARQTFEEVLRYTSPFHSVFRTTTEPVTIEELQLGAGQKVLLVMGAANLDPDRWAEPERFDIHRKPVGHVALGTGIHGCVGQAVARQEVECLLRAVAAKIDTLELAGEPVWIPGNTLRALDKLPLRCTSRT